MTYRRYPAVRQGLGCKRPMGMIS
ncbi:hypothetical protein SCOCK_30339 [Actinacidiphila cocklensis]|uniref:Uncharacterized protein n=1 Tax=Actinacidiphila cocklensis TaxID=887465 RepID=A0A9W4GST9_9ACTN|nr:hypothetical protein SCOCK_30339 [Actinacidiphila cocklensis]